MQMNVFLYTVLPIKMINKTTLRKLNARKTITAIITFQIGINKQLLELEKLNRS